MRCDEGYSSYLEVLDAERSLFNVELSYTSSQSALFRATVNTYKTMGGDGVQAAAQAVTPPQVKERGLFPEKEN